MPAAEVNRVPLLTQEKLRTDHPEGTRHQAKLDLAMSLIGNGIPSDQVAAILWQKFPGATEREIEDVVEWADSHDPQPSGREHGYRKPENFMRGRYRAPEAPRKPDGPPPATEALRTLRDWLGEVVASENDLSYASPVKPASNFKDDAALLFRHLYESTDLINVVVEYTEATTAEGRHKANPRGPGKVLLADEWVSWIARNGVPSMKAGTWVRPNPVTSKTGSGKGGAIMDKDIAAPRFVLLESDSLPLQYQLTAMAVFKLPIAAIMTSGGASYHAWVKIDAVNLMEHEHVSERILAAVQKFGFDSCNKNPSRLSRLPGVFRQIRHGEGNGQQRLIYLNPNPEWKAIL